MNRKMLIGCLLISLSASTLWIRSVEPEPYKARIGVYDNRAIAIAYTMSEYNPISDKMEKYKKAKADGDAQTVKALEEWGEKLQRQLHRQGFGKVPVSDLLEPVKGQIPDLSKQLNVDVIAMECDYSAQTVNVVDITDDLVDLFNPTQETLEKIKSIRKVEPIDLDEIENYKH